MNQTKIYTIRGAGLGFLLAAIVFVFTWSPLTLLLVPLGAVTGYLLSRLDGIDQRVTENLSRSPTGRALSRLASFLTSPKLGVRFISLWALGLTLLLLAWTLGYFVLPEGLFRQAAVSQLESRGLGGLADSVAAEWRRIFLNNLIPFGLIVLANLVTRSGGFPLGYIPPLYNITLYGLFLGTNSFAIPNPQRLAPTFAILGRSGPYEMTAFVMAAAATATWSFRQLRQLLRANPEREAGPAEVSWKQVVILLLALALLATAAWIEASRIVSSQ